MLHFQAVTMAKNDKSDLSTFRSACLELTRLLAKEGQHFSLEIKIGDQFSFSAQSKGIRRQPALGSSDGGIWKKKKKSASAMERDRRRKIAFLKRKGVPLSPATSLVSTSLVTSTATSDAASRQTEKLASHTAQGKGRSTGSRACSTTVAVHMTTWARIHPVKRSGKESWCPTAHAIWLWERGISRLQGVSTALKSWAGKLRRIWET